LPKYLRRRHPPPSLIKSRREHRAQRFDQIAAAFEVGFVPRSSAESATGAPLQAAAALTVAKLSGFPACSFQDPATGHFTYRGLSGWPNQSPSQPSRAEQPRDRAVFT